MTGKPRTRKATAAERLAARVLGQEIPDVIELPTQTPGEQHLARLRARQAVPARPAAGVSPAEWHARRYQGRDDDPGPSAA
ncbi:hypothetical protein [Streptomyces sp. SYSU K21746]